MEPQEQELSDLCVGKPLSKLQAGADWSYFTSEHESLDEYWSERDGFEAGVRAGGKRSFSTFVGYDIDDEDEDTPALPDDDTNNGLVLIFVGVSFDEAKAKVEGI